MKKRIIIFGNGRLEKDFLRYLKDDDFIIGVDYAAFWLIENGIIPRLAIGDFDSVNENQLDVIEKKSGKVLKYDPEKDFTDMELAVGEAVIMNPAEVVIFGATGSRIDHGLANVYLLQKLMEKHIPTSMRDMNNEIFLAGGETDITKNDMKYVSILPLTEAVKVTLSGFRYNVNKKVITKNSSLGISNEMTGQKAKVIIDDGIAIIIRSKD